MTTLAAPVRPATHQTAVLLIARLVIVVLLVVALVTNMEPKYYAIKITLTYPDGQQKVMYHTGGRGNGAFANVYEEHQVKRILGQYAGGAETLQYKGSAYERIRKAETVQVSFK